MTNSTRRCAGIVGLLAAAATTTALIIPVVALAGAASGPVLSCTPLPAAVHCAWTAPAGFNTSVLMRIAGATSATVAGPATVSSYDDASAPVGTVSYIAGVTDGTTRLFSNRVTVTVRPKPLHVGYVGCSNTWMAVEGYHDVAVVGTMWPAMPTYSGGTIDVWSAHGAFPLQLWSAFDAQRAVAPPDVVWWQVCAHPGAAYTNAVTTLSMLRNRIGASVPVYASPLATYSVAGECPMADTTTSAAITKQLIAANLVLPGPTLQVLSPATTLDGCHPLPGAVRDVDGGVLRAFFG